jgi:hypothetical protein
LSSATDAGIGTAGLLRFAELIEERLGLQFDSSALTELRVILHERMRALRCPFDAYLHHLEAAGTMRAELRELAQNSLLARPTFFAAPSRSPCFPSLRYRG